MTTATIDTAADLPAVSGDDRAFLGHPKGLGYLAFTEAWERFSFYGMQSLLVLYMAKYLLLPGQIDSIAFFASFRQLYGSLQGPALASAIFGTYAALVYFTPTIGGFIADRWIGKRRAVLAGALTMALGHFLMAFEASFLFALLVLVIGSGLFKGNLASQIGSLYRPDDLRRADAFQIYYLAINAGVIAAPLIAGTLGEAIGWDWGFGAAGVGMVIGTIIYLAGQRHLPPEPARNTNVAAPVRERMRNDDWIMLGVVLLLVPVLALAVLPNQEIFNAYLLWGDSQFQLVFFGTLLPTTWLITLDAIVSVSFLAIVALFFRWYARHWREPDELSKIIIGMGFAIGGMLCLYIAAATQPPGGKIGLFWPVADRLCAGAAGGAGAVRPAGAPAVARDRGGALFTVLLRRQRPCRMDRRFLHPHGSYRFLADACRVCRSSCCHLHRAEAGAPQQAGKQPISKPALTVPPGREI